MQRRQVIVVGAGPVGTVAALACARFGMDVTLLEAQSKIDDSPRASTTQPPTLEILAELDFARLKDETAFPYVVQTEQHKLATMAIGRLQGRAQMGARVTGVSQSGERVSVQTERETLSA